MLFGGRVLGPAGRPLVTSKAEVFTPHSSQVYPGKHERVVDLVQVGNVGSVLWDLL